MCIRARCAPHLGDNEPVVDPRIMRVTFSDTDRGRRNLIERVRDRGQSTVSKEGVDHTRNVRRRKAGTAIAKTCTCSASEPVSGRSRSQRVSVRRSDGQGLWAAQE